MNIATGAVTLKLAPRKRFWHTIKCPMCSVEANMHASTLFRFAAVDERGLILGSSYGLFPSPKLPLLRAVAIRFCRKMSCKYDCIFHFDNVIMVGLQVCTRACFSGDDWIRFIVLV